MLRKHQVEFEAIIKKIAHGEHIKNIYAHVTPGGGKSILPIIAGKLIESGLADKMIWIAPRLSLVDQAEREFVNPYFRDLLGHNLRIRASTNENNPCRGLHGFTTTYNAVGMDEGILINEFKRWRYVLIMDEFHHVQEASLWHEKLQPLWGMATYRVMMTGTCERGDGNRIAFLPYGSFDRKLTPDLADKHDTAIVSYTRTDALNERAIIPLSFHLSDGKAEWQEPTGKKRSIASLDKMDDIYASKAIYTALKTEYADDLLNAGLSHWVDHRRQNPRAKCLIVTSNIAEAKRHIENIKAKGIKRFSIATSEDSPEAQKAINDLKQHKLDGLVCVAMVYEGLDVPSATHGILLTRVRSVPWIEQAVCRLNRYDGESVGHYEQQMGYVFAPADPLFKEIVSRIEAEQLPFLEDRDSRKGGKKSRLNNDEFSLSLSPGGITALSSEMTGKREIVLGNGNGHPQERTASEIEADLLKQIEKHVRAFSFQNRYNPKKINSEVYACFGTARRDMTIKELETVLKHVQNQYPLSKVRGTGRPRVATKAQPFNCTWKDS